MLGYNVGICSVSFLGLYFAQDVNLGLLWNTDSLMHLVAPQELMIWDTDCTQCCSDVVLQTL